MTVLTIGHSTRSLDEFVALLEAHGVVQVADVRTLPRSRRHPHFAYPALSSSLGDLGLGYRHFPALGGLRRPRSGSPNVGWRNASFRGYADHMQTASFAVALDDLMGFAARGQTAVMCAESLWWRCHRRLLADALCVRGVTVGHILTAAPPQPHQLCEFARNDNGVITYLADVGVPCGVHGNRKRVRSV